MALIANMGGSGKVDKYTFSVISMGGYTRTVFCTIKLTAEQMAGFTKFKISPVIGTPQEQTIALFVDTTNVQTASSTAPLNTDNNIPSYSDYIIFRCYVQLGTSGEVPNYGEMLLELS